MAAKGRTLLFSASPHQDESFVGYLLRLKDVNRYQTLSWILQLAEIKDYAHSRFSFALRGSSLDVAPLARLTGVEESALAAMLYIPLRISRQRMMGDYSVFGSSVPHYLIQIRKPKICPRCLQESNYARKIWEIAPVTACPLHQCLLLDECPSCCNRITWNRAGVSLCRCGFDWRDHQTSLLDSSELEVVRQIHLLCNLPFGSPFPDTLRNNPLYRLGLQEFISGLIFIASQLAGITQRKGQPTIDTKGKHFAPSRRSAEIHALLCKALPVFDNWPNNYYSFLDWRREQKSLSPNAPAHDNNFTEYKSALFIRLASADFEFMRKAFLEYKQIRHYESRTIVNVKAADLGKRAAKESSPPKRSHTSLPRQPRGNISEINKSHVSGSKAVRDLKTGWQGLEKLLASGTLNGVINHKGNHRVFLIDKGSLEDLKAKVGQSLSLNKVRRLLGVPSKRVYELIECNMLTPFRGPGVDGFKHWRFDQKEVTELIHHLTGKLPKEPRVDRQRVLNFTSLLSKISGVGIDLGVFLQAILDGDITPLCVAAGSGLRRLLFSEKQITNYVQSKFQLLAKESMSLPMAAKFMGLSLRAVYFLVKNGMLSAQKFESAPSMGRFVKQRELNAFNRKYVLVKQLASEHHIFTNQLLNLLVTRGTRPISGRKVDSGLVYVFKKSDIARLDIAMLISEERKNRAIAIESTSSATPKAESPKTVTRSKPERHQPRGLPPILDEDQTAKVLKLEIEAVRLLAERGILKPHKRLSNEKKKERRYYFSSYTIRKYKENGYDRGGFIAFISAAKLFKLWPDNFYNRFIRTGRLKPVVADGRRSEHFFRVEDVEALLKIEGQTIITPEVAEILGVNVSCVDKMIVAGILKPISGPAIDGFGKNLFLRSDAEQLHAEREAFKVKRLNKGMTTRYGWPLGPRARPVRDVIGPRIEQLLEQWRKESPSQYISGYKIYQQLVSEGYRLGIASVYVELRQKHYRAA